MKDIRSKKTPWKNEKNEKDMQKKSQVRDEYNMQENADDSKIGARHPRGHEAEILFEWKTQEYVGRRRSSDWFWAFGIIAISLAAAAFIFGNALFGIFILLASFTLILFMLRRPERVSVAVTTKGIQAGSTEYAYRSLESFWVDEDLRKLILTSQSLFMPHIVLPLSEDIDEEVLRGILGEYLSEEETVLPAVYQILEALGL